MNLPLLSPALQLSPSRDLLLTSRERVAACSGSRLPERTPLLALPATLKKELWPSPCTGKRR